MLEKCVLTILELNWNQRLGHKKTKINICHHMLTSSTRLQNRSFHVVERTRTSTKCQKMKYAKRAKILFFIVKYANMWSFCCRRRRGCLSSLLGLKGRRGRWSSCPKKLHNAQINKRWNWEINVFKLQEKQKRWQLLFSHLLKQLFSNLAYWQVY